MKEHREHGKSEKELERETPVSWLQSLHVTRCPTEEREFNLGWQQKGFLVLFSTTRIRNEIAKLSWQKL